jgi:hypothetical protein
MKVIVRVLYVLAIFIIVITAIGLLPLGPNGQPIGCFVPVMSGFYACSLEEENALLSEDSVTPSLDSATPTVTSEG